MSRTIVVTGSASGIGATTARILRERGHRVIGVDLRDADVTADLAHPPARETAAMSVADLAEGRVDAVIACAGIAAPVPAAIAVNFFGVTELLTALLPVLRHSDSPRAAVVSSMATLQPHSPELVEAALSGDENHALDVARGLLTHEPDSGYIVYPSSKRALSRWVRRESVTAAWAGSGIPLNAVAPGTVLTPMTDRILADPRQLEIVDTAVPMPLHYHQPPESIAHLLIWLTSPENTHLAGQVIFDDGGADAVLRGDDIWSWAD